MYFKISKKEFYSALATVARAISTFSPLPAFSGIKIDVLADEIVLTASDSNISIQTRLHKGNDSTLEIHDMGAIVMEAKYILEIVRKIDSVDIEVEIIDGTLTKLSGNNAEFKINGMLSEEYPNIDFRKPNESFTLTQPLLKKMITQTIFATSDKENRPVLTGINFACNDHELRCIATDSYRLAIKTIEIDNASNFNITIPSKSLQEVVKILSDESFVEIGIDDKKAQFIIGNTIVQTRLIDGIYPETNRLIPLHFDYELTIDAHDLLTAIDRASFIKSEGVYINKFNLSENECVLSSNSLVVGSSTEVLNSASFSGNHLEISFNGGYLFDAIKALDGQLVKISFCGELKPFIIQSVDDETVLQLVLPVRTYA